MTLEAGSGWICFLPLWAPIIFFWWPACGSTRRCMGSIPRLQLALHSYPLGKKISGSPQSGVGQTGGRAAQGKEGAGGSVCPAPQFARSVSVPMADGFFRQSHAGFAGGPVRNSVTGAVERAIEQGNHGNVGCSTSLQRSDRSGVRGQLPPSSFPPTESLQWSFPCPPPCTYRRGSGPP